jgi:indolepyruvate decarboxylase
VYENVFAQDAPDGTYRFQPRVLITPPQEMDRSVKHFMRAVGNSKNPIAWVGPDITRFNARADMMKWIGKSGISFVTSVNSKSVIDEKNERFAGVYAGRSSSRAVIDLVHQADTIFVFGETTTEIEAFGQTISEVWGNNSSKRIIFINTTTYVEPQVFSAGPVYIREFMNTLGSSTDVVKVNGGGRNVNPFTSGQKESISTEQGLTYDGITQAFGQSSLMSGAFTVVDSTLGIISTLSMPQAQDTFFSTFSSDSYGTAIATATGISHGIQNNKRPVIFVGDGGFQQSGHHIPALSKIRPNSVIVVFDNQLLAFNQWTTNPRAFSGPREPVDSFNQVGKWNMTKMGEAFDATTIVCESMTQLVDAIRKTESSDKMHIIDCKINSKSVPINSQWRIPQQQ